MKKKQNMKKKQQQQEGNQNKGIKVQINILVYLIKLMTQEFDMRACQ